MTGAVERISRGQFFLMVTVSVVAGGVYIWPSYLVQRTGVDAVYGLALPLLLAVAVTWMQARTVAAATGIPYTVVLAEAWSTGTAKIIGPVMALLDLAMDAVLLALYADLLRTFFYPLTPRIVTAGAIAAVVAWTAGRPLAVVARNVQFWLPLLLLSLLLLVILSVGNLRYPDAIIPHVTFKIPAVAMAGVGTWFLYTNFGITGTLLPSVRSTKPGSLPRTAVLAILFQGMILLLFLFLLQGILGPASVSRLEWPLISMFSRVEVPTFFLSGIGMFVLLCWTVALVLYLSVHAFTMGWNIQAIWLGERAKRWPVVVAGAAAMVGGAMAIPSIEAARTLLFDWVTPAALGWTLLVVPSTYLRRLWQRRRAGGGAP